MKTLPGLLLLDDDPDMHLLLKQATPPLVQFYAETNSQAAMSRLQSASIDILVLDLNLGNDETGFTFLEKAKKSFPTLPGLILILTASDNEADEIHAHELGVAAFVRKPLRPQAFRALIEKHLRQVMSDEQQVVDIGPYRLDRARLKVWVKNGQAQLEIMLTVKEFQLLLKLIQRPEQVFTREQLLEDVWGHDGNIQSRTVDTHVSSLRKKLGTAGDGFMSVRGMGYKWSPH